MELQLITEEAKRNAPRLAVASTRQKNAAICAFASKLKTRKQDVLGANEADLAESKSRQVPDSLVNRLRFGEEKIHSRIKCLEKIIALPDPVGQVFRSSRRPDGLVASRVRVPIGVILMIYEARPHVTVNAGALCLKSGNAAILRGGSEARRCNSLLDTFWRESLVQAGLPSGAVQIIDCSHEEVDQLLQMEQHIDLVIPRCGKALIKAVSGRSRIPVIKHFEGVCHVYLDGRADLKQAIDIALDSKCLMPEVCNAMETLLVSRHLTRELPEIVQAFQRSGCTVRGCEKTLAAAGDVGPATEEDWRTEYLDNIVSVRVVDSVDEAIEHINHYSSHHTDAIVTDSESNARRFVEVVDSAVVLVNASTMFCDGESLGMGAEIGISTDRIHAQGPMGLEELTTYKHVIRGSGHVMGNEDLWQRSEHER